MLTDTRAISYITDEGEIANSRDSQTGDGRAAYDGTIADSTEQQVLLAFDKDAISSVCVYSKQAQITVRSNANHLGSPDDTFVVGAGQAFIWNLNDPASNVNPFSHADVTSLYITNESATAATDVKIRVLLDITP